ncbi:hypothetical protein PCE1_000338 [Barthelona sp. PCE]
MSDFELEDDNSLLELELSVVNSFMRKESVQFIDKLLNKGGDPDDFDALLNKFPHLCFSITESIQRVLVYGVSVEDLISTDYGMFEDTITLFFASPQPPSHCIQLFLFALLSTANSYSELCAPMIKDYIITVTKNVFDIIENESIAKVPESHRAQLCILTLLALKVQLSLEQGDGMFSWFRSDVIMYAMEVAFLNRHTTFFEVFCTLLIPLLRTDGMGDLREVFNSAAENCAFGMGDEREFFFLNFSVLAQNVLLRTVNLDYYSDTMEYLLPTGFGLVQNDMTNKTIFKMVFPKIRPLLNDLASGSRSIALSNMIKTLIDNCLTEKNYSTIESLFHWILDDQPGEGYLSFLLTDHALTLQNSIPKNTPLSRMCNLIIDSANYEG